MTLTLHGSDALNSLNPDVLYELRAISDEVRGRKDVWAILLQGEGRHFSGGMDVEFIRERIKRSEMENREILLNMQCCLDAFEALETPTVAKLKGFCYGGGLLLALSCDFRIVSQRTIFCLPEIRLGLGVIMGTQRVTRVAGLAATKEMILLGKRFKAGDALAYGLVHQVVSPGDLDDTVAAFVKRFETLPPRSVGIAKRIIDEGYHMSMRASQELEIDLQAALLGTSDIQEAVDSYIGKRQPHFTGE
jgi:enoyl-CoA hydratase/carnithine racemase